MATCFRTTAKALSHTMPSVIDKMKDMKARATPYYQPEQEEDSLCPKLSLKQRITGFATCAGLGFFCMVLVMFSIFPIPSPVRMGFFLTLGNLFAITSTGFLVGMRSCGLCLDMVILSPQPPPTHNAYLLATHRGYPIFC